MDENVSKGDSALVTGAVADKDGSDPRVTLRLRAETYARLRSQAKRLGLTVNQACNLIFDVIGDEQLALAMKGRPMPIPQRHAMQALYAIFGEDEDTCARNWVCLYDAGIVTIGRNPDLNQPERYARQLWSDGHRVTHHKKKWIFTPPSDGVMKCVRQVLPDSRTLLTPR